MKFTFQNTAVQIKNGKVYCKDALTQQMLTMFLQSAIVSNDDQHINPLNVFINDLEKLGGLSNVVYEKGDDDDEENGMIH